MHDFVGRNGYPWPVGRSGFPSISMRARFGARAIGLVATISSGLRVLQRLEPIANVLGDLLVLAIIAGVEAERWAKD